MPENALTGGCVRIRVNKPTDRGVVVAGVEPIPARLGVVKIASVAQGGEVCNMACIVCYIVAVATFLPPLFYHIVRVLSIAHLGERKCGLYL